MMSGQFYSLIAGQWVSPGRPHPGTNNRTVRFSSLRVSGAGYVDSFVDKVTRPDATNTGVGVIRPAPTAVINGNVTLTDGQQLLDKIVLGNVITASGATVLIENCDIRGQASGETNNTALVQPNNGAMTTVRFCKIRPQTPNLWVDAILARNYDAYRNDISGTVDGLGMYSAASGGPINASARCNYIHDLAHFQPDPNHPASGTTVSMTHNDGIQIQFGDGGVIVGNNIQAFYDQTVGTQPTPDPIIQLSAIMFNANNGPTTNLLIDSNWFNGGQECVNAGGPTTGSLSITNNRFDSSAGIGNGETQGAVMTVRSGISLNYSGNIHTADGTPVVPKITT